MSKVLGRNFTAIGTVVAVAFAGLLPLAIGSSAAPSGAETAATSRTVDQRERSDARSGSGDDLVAGDHGARAATELPCEATHKLPDIGVHDPFIMPDPVSGIYYLYQGRTARMSIDLVNWCAPQTVFTVPEGTWANPRQAPWAPEAWYFNGKYYWFGTLHNRNTVLAEASTQGQACGDCGQIWQTQTARGTIVAKSDSPMGPFEMVNTESPVAPADFMTLDGTLFVDRDGTPWMVYAHEWIQKIDGTIEAIRLEQDEAGDLTGRGTGDPIYLFKGSDAPWYGQEARADNVQLPPYVTDAPSFFRTASGELLMYWTSYRKHNNEYVVTRARSESGELTGPWTQEDVVITENKGHSMLFWTFADKGEKSQLIMALHNNMNRQNIRTELYEMKATGNDVSVVRQRTDIDGDPVSSWVWPIE